MQWRFALFLPEPAGRFPVGATTFTTPVRPRRVVGSVMLRSTRQHALQLEEVAFTAYYPTDLDSSASTKKGWDWVTRPLWASSRGLARFLSVPLFVIWPLVYLFGAFLKVPVYPNAPLLNPLRTRKFSSGRVLPEQWPLVIYSHGLGGSRTAYSQLCSRIAASGKVVLAIEHRDGTGYAAAPQIWGPQGRYPSRPIVYTRNDDVIIDDSAKTATPLPFRTDQLDFRKEEIYTAYDTFCKFLRKDSTLELSTIDDSIIDTKSWSPEHAASMMPVSYSENVILAGHSFGGCTMLSILSTGPPKGHDFIPVSHALILDPWLEPLPKPCPTPKLCSGPPTPEHLTDANSKNTLTNGVAGSSKRSEHPRMLVINSEAFTVWTDHFARLQNVIRAWAPEGRRIITLVGSQHTAFSDSPILPLVKTKASQLLLDTICRLSVAFIDDELEDAVASYPQKDLEFKMIEKKKPVWPRRKIVGNVGDIVVT